MTDPTQEPETLAEYVRHGMERLGLDSIRKLQVRAGVAPETAQRIVNGTGVPTEETLKKIADALGLSIQRMRELAGRPRGERQPFVLPERANQLNKRQREAVVELIDAFLEERPTQPSAGNGRTPPPDE